MNTNDRILVTGGAGLVGAALVRKLKTRFSNVISLTRKECDLEDRQAVRNVFRELRPDYVFHIAAKVGGINANISNPVAFLQSNILSETHVIETCNEIKVKKFLFLGSSCIYPRECPQPMKEEYLLTGPLEPTNEGYALAKIVGIRLVQYYQKQFGFNAVCPMPCNVYGPGDSFDLSHSHVLSALVKRFVDAKRTGAPSVTLWGTGSAKREFIYIDDLVDGMIFTMENVNTPEIHNLGTGVDFSIRELAEMIARLVGYSGQLAWDPTKPDGMPRKCLDTSRMEKLGFKTKVGIEQGILNTIADYERRFPG